MEKRYASREKYLWRVAGNGSKSPDLAIDPTSDAIHYRKTFDIYRLTGVLVSSALIGRSTDDGTVLLSESRTVSLERLDRVLIGRNAVGKRTYVAQRVTGEDLAAIRQCVRFTLGLAD